MGQRITAQTGVTAVYRRCFGNPRLRLRIFSTETSSSMSYLLKAPNDASVPTSAYYDLDQDPVPNTFILSAHSSVPQDSKCRHPTVNPLVHKPSFLLGPIIANIPTSHASSFRTLDMAQLNPSMVRLDPRLWLDFSNSAAISHPHHHCHGPFSLVVRYPQISFFGTLLLSRLGRQQLTNQEPRPDEPLLESHSVNSSSLRATCSNVPGININSNDGSQRYSLFL